MSDIIERLHGPDGMEAAQEILRLREENARLRDIVRKYLEGSMREKDIRAAAAAIRERDAKSE